MFVLDSNIISYYFRADKQVVSNLQALRPSELAVPAIVEYELRYGLQRLPAQSCEPRLAALNQLLQAMHSLAFDRACAAFAADIRIQLEAAGKPIGPHDTLIAATALRYQATLVTRNIREFSRVEGLNWISWD